MFSGSWIWATLSLTELLWSAHHRPPAMMTTKAPTTAAAIAPLLSFIRDQARRLRRLTMPSPAVRLR